MVLETALVGLVNRKLEVMATIMHTWGYSELVPRRTARTPPMHIDSSTRAANSGGTYGASQKYIKTLQKKRDQHWPI
ncbi:hypothetical protein DPMN_186293 [Dreissena polymorpha]|uniref:Uncharacterized protein n=1 Tax=Dreissena polymorpha TaxID=45954 RepID=A0A9D4DM08_DREPO|nr:hypothetical protein DPMN_186293 [Dreissena polymorpha]